MVSPPPGLEGPLLFRFGCQAHDAFVWTTCRSSVLTASHLFLALKRALDRAAFANGQKKQRRAS